MHANLYEPPKKRSQFSLAGMLLTVTATSALLAIHAPVIHFAADRNANLGNVEFAISLLMVLDVNVLFWLIVWAACVNRIVRVIVRRIVVGLIWLIAALVGLVGLVWLIAALVGPVVLVFFAWGTNTRG